MMNRKIALPALAGAALVGLVGVAAAAPAVMNTTANVRAGPGTSYHIVNTARRGETVDVQGCDGGWCYIRKSGPDGWVAARFLGRAPSGPVINFQFNFGNPPRPPSGGPGMPPPGGPGMPPPR